MFMLHGALDTVWSLVNKDDKTGIPVMWKPVCVCSYIHFLCGVKWVTVVYDNESNVKMQ